jgi:hypothetical protein
VQGCELQSFAANVKAIATHLRRLNPPPAVLLITPPPVDSAVGLYTCVFKFTIQLTHGLKAPGFTTLEPMKWKTGFKVLLFQTFNLLRYSAAWHSFCKAKGYYNDPTPDRDLARTVGAVQVDFSWPVALESTPGLNPWAYDVKSWFQNLLLSKFNVLRRYSLGRYAATVADVAREVNVPCVDLFAGLTSTPGWEQEFLSVGGGCPGCPLVGSPQRVEPLIHFESFVNPCEPLWTIPEGGAGSLWKELCLLQ